MNSTIHNKKDIKLNNITNKFKKKEKFGRQKCRTDVKYNTKR